MLLKADYLNAHCHCKALDKEQLAYPQYFSEQPHFISRGDLAQIEKFIIAYETALKTQPAGYSSVSPGFAGEPVEPKPGANRNLEKGIFNSYDFHISENGPQLIEINTNAAGAVLGLYATESLHECCDQSYLKELRSLPLLNAAFNLLPTTVRFDANQLVEMFRREAALRFPERELTTVAIVDENPEQQFFHPEFLLVQKLLRTHNIGAVIAAPEEITIRDNIPYAKAIPLDFIYNRLTDFYFEKPGSQSLKDIYERGLATVSPNPTVHALYARKSKLAEVWSPAFDSAVEIDLIRRHIPETLFVTDANRDELWRTRKNWFFKPISGFGGKAVYRGDKLTARVWSEIANGEYIAQKYVPAQTRQITADLSLKYDIRVYTYGDEILGIMARYYQGQTTNFRTEHGGLASVMVAA